MANLLLHITWMYIFLSFVSRTDSIWLVYPKYGGVFKFVMSVGVPLKLGKKQNLSYAMNFQYQVTQPTNFSQISGIWPPIYARGKRDASENFAKQSDRSLFYLAMEKLMEKYGMNGRECLLRAICENAISSVEHDGLFGELVHILLTPDYGDGETDPDLNPVYLEAQRAGELGLDCELVYKSCPDHHALMDMVSILDI